jgi:glyoxylase-like metal-dependent hydrolase (beta-lactamase superfamily II)
MSFNRVAAMSHRAIAPGLYELRLGQVNAHLIDDDDEGLTLIDTGYPVSADMILGAIRELGHSPKDLRHIIVTHCHEDHAGSLAELKRLTPARSYMHPIDAAMTRQGRSLRPLSAGPGLLNRLIYKLIVRKAQASIEPAEVDQEVADGEVLPIAGGLRVIHAPGHCAGQIALHWPRHGGVLFAADTCASMFGLAMSPAYEDLELGRPTLARLAGEEFAIATFGHGKPITGGAAAKFRRKFQR